MQQQTSGRRACTIRQDNNNGEQCNHCGQSGHLCQGCRTERRNPANTVTAPAKKDNQNEQYRDMYKLVTDRIQHLEAIHEQ